MYVPQVLPDGTHYACTRIDIADQPLQGHFGCKIFKDLGEGAAIIMQKVLISDHPETVGRVAEWMASFARRHEVDYVKWAPVARQMSCDRVVGPGAEEFRQRNCPSIR